MATTKKPELCLAPGCTRCALHRGLCKACYPRAGRAVRDGAVTWEKLIELGLCEASPATATNPFTVALALGKALANGAPKKKGRA